MSTSYLPVRFRSVRFLGIVVVTTLLALLLVPAPSAFAASGDVRISDVTVTEGNSGTKTFSFTVTAEGAIASFGSSVAFSTSDSSAVAGQDYTAASGRVTLDDPTVPPSDAVQGTISVTVSGDTTPEPDEFFTVVLFDPDDGLTLIDRIGVGTIVNDDGGPDTPTFSVIDTQISESGGTGRVLVRISPAPAEAESVDVEVSDGTAEASMLGSDDYDPPFPDNPRTLEFAAGQEEAFFDITINGDEVFEGNETVVLKLEANSAGTAIGDGDGTLTIIDDETAPQLAVNDDSVAENASGDAGVLTFTVTSSIEAEDPVEVTWALADGSGANPATAADSDYTAATGTVTIAAGATEASTDITVNPTDDANVEPDEVLEVRLSNPTAGAQIADGVGAGTITNDDTGDRTIRVDDAVAIREGDDADQQRFLEFPVRLNGYAAKHTPEDNTITVGWSTQSASATAGSDFEAASGTVTIPEGQVTPTEPIRVRVRGDLAQEGDEVVVVLLQEPVTGPATFASGSGGDGVILDDDPNLSVLDASLSEGDEGTAKRLGTRIVLSAAVDYDVVVDYDTADGTATAGQDYRSRPDGARGPGNGTATIPAGQTFVAIDVPLIGDDTAEADETLTLTLSNPRTDPEDEPIFLADATATLTITSDDEAVVGGDGPLTVDAGADLDVDSTEIVELTADLDGVTGDVDVTWDFGDGATATGTTVTHAWAASGDYTVSVRATDDEDTATDTVEVTVDDDAEATRSFGGDRVATAVDAARDHWDAADTVLLGTSVNFPDALAAGPYAATLDAPLLLTPPNGLPAEVLDVLDDLGTDTVVILGGEGAVPAGIADQLDAAGLDVERIDGGDRYDTAARLAREVGAPDREAVVALGAAADPNRAWPDALGAGAYNALEDPLPVLLSAGDDVPDVTLATLRALAVTDVTLLGGEVALSAAVEQELEDAGFDVRRLAGADRYATSVLVAEDALDRFGDAQARPVFVTGTNFPDGLAAGAVAARVRGPVVLVPSDQLPTGTSDFLTDNAEQLDDPVFMGGDLVITGANRARITAAIEAAPA